MRTRRGGPAPDTPGLAPTRSATTEPRRGSRTRASHGIRSHRLSRVASTIAPTSPTRPEIGERQISTRAPVGSSAAPRRAAPRGRLVDSPTVAAAYDVQAPRSGAVSRQVDSSARRAAAADTTTAARPRRRRRRVVLAPRRRARRRSFEPKCPRETGPALVRCRAKNATASLASRARWWQWFGGGKGAYSRLARADDIVARRLNQILFCSVSTVQPVSRPRQQLPRYRSTWYRRYCGTGTCWYRRYCGTSA